MLSHAGLSISSTTINTAINALSKEGTNKLRALGNTLTAAYAYDNFDVALDVATPTIEKGGGVLAHLTSGTLIPLIHGTLPRHLECSNELHMKLNEGLGALPRHPWRVIHHIHPDAIDSNGLTYQGRFQAWQFRHDLVKYGPVYFRRFRNELGEPESIEKIPVVATHQVPAYAMDIAQSTAKGNAEAIENLLRQGGVGDPASHPNVKDMTHHVILIHRDLSTFECIESIQDS